MMDFFVEGGWGMFPILALGLVALGGGVRFAADPRNARLPLVAGTSATLLLAVVHATVMDLAAVLHYLGDGTNVPDGQVVRVLLVGLKECTRPAGLGGAFLVLASTAVCVGLWRQARRQLGPDVA